MSKELNIYIAAGYVASFTTDAITSGSYVRLPNPGGSNNTPTDFTVSTAYTIGPFNDPYTYKIYYNGTEPVVTLSNSGVYTAADDTALAAKAPIIVTSNVGTAATGVTAVEYGTGYQHMSVLTINTTLPAISAAANQAIGKLLYTLPAGAEIIHASYMSAAITQSEGNINADTPDVGLGTVQATGANALLSSAGATTENILTGQTAANCTGTATVKTMSGSAVVTEAGGTKTVYLNVADGWAGADAAPILTGTVVLHWYFFN